MERKREADYRARRRQAGESQISVWLTEDENDCLAYLMEEWSCGLSDAVRFALAKAVEGIEATLAEVAAK